MCVEIMHQFWILAECWPKILEHWKKEENNLFDFDHIHDHQVNPLLGYHALGIVYYALCTKHFALDKPARLTIVTDCETSAATPWERLQEK